MLDTARAESSLEAKRRDLTAKIIEGRGVIAQLMERHAAMGRKIDEATEGLRRLEEQLDATKTVIELFDDESLMLAANSIAAPGLTLVPPVPQPAVAWPAVAWPVASRTPPPSGRFRPLTYLRCLATGHEFVTSRSLPGHATCRRCKKRRPL